jgi:hypothetical protein
MTNTTNATAREAAEEKLLKDAAMALSLVAAAVLVLRALAASFALYGSLLPVLYLYGLQTCPPASTFDAKAQLVCVLRGDALPADHPDKPKSSGIAGFVAGAIAVLTSELATLPGYEVSVWSLLWGVGWMATVTMPTSDLRCTWIGCNHKWYYWGSERLSSETADIDAVVGTAGVGAPAFPESASVTIGKTNIKFDFGTKKD